MKMAVALACFGFAGSAAALDIYIGTITVKDRQVILTRCDIAQNRYVLLDDPKDKDDVVAAIAAASHHDSGFVYGEVIGEYQERNGTNELIVSAINDVTPGKSCHLIDPVR